MLVNAINTRRQLNLICALLRTLKFAALIQGHKATKCRYQLFSTFSYGRGMERKYEIEDLI